MKLLIVEDELELLNSTCVYLQKEDFVCEEDQTGFCKLMGRLDEEDIINIHERHRYRHRFCQDGTPLYYYAVVGEKKSAIPMDMLAEVTG